MHIKTLFGKSNLVRVVLLGGVTAVAPFFAAAAATGNDSEQVQQQHDHEHMDHGHGFSARLVQQVREATRQFIDVNAATAYGYEQFLGCVSGPDQGAMGVHYVNGDLVGDGEIEASRPEALIYESLHGRMRLVGVEFIVDSATWDAHHKTPPVLEGQTFQFVNSPNRFGLKPFYELHVWAWRDNPNGAFVDWNTRVTCEGQ